MIAKSIDAAAKMARLMFDLGQGGKTKAEALEAALSKVPAGIYSDKLKGALRHYFK